MFLSLVTFNVSLVPRLAVKSFDKLMGLSVSEGCHLIVFMVFERPYLFLQAQCSKHRNFSEAG